MTTSVGDIVRRTVRHYAGGSGSERPLSGYVTVLGAYAGLVGAAAVLARLTGRRPPERVSAGDVVLLTAATHKASRLLTKDSVLSPLRAPFTRYREATGEGEVLEEVTGHGVRHAVGELVTCPFCSAVWVASGLVGGLVFAPRLTRLVAAALTAVAGADFLQIGYDAAKQALDKLGE
jgi:Protein of unknown function (DUF1360)